MLKGPKHFNSVLKSTILLGVLIFTSGFCDVLLAQKMNVPVYWKANRFGQNHGLLQLNVKAMELDNLGYLWVGTEDGLHRFNGYEFKAFVHNPSDSSSLIDDHIRGLLWNNRILWIATSAGGIASFVPSLNRFDTPNLDTTLNSFNTSFKVFTNSDSTLLLSVHNHFIIYNVSDGTRSVYKLPISGKSSYVTDVLPISPNKCWLATTASGLLEFDMQTLEVKQLQFLDSLFINCMYRFKNKIYIGTETGMVAFNLDTDSVEATNFQYPTNCFYEQSPDGVLIGTDNGMFLFQLPSDEITPIILDVDDNRVYESLDINQILGDKKGNLWIGTEGDGLLYYNVYQKKFNTVKVNLTKYPLTADISTFQILKETESSLLLGTKLGVVRYNTQKQGFSLFPLTKNMLIYTLKRDNVGTIWAGGFTSGLLKYDDQNDRFQKIIPQGETFADEDIIEILPVDSRTLWIATWSGGMYRFDTQTIKLHALLPGGKTINRARTSFIDSKGNSWLGTDEGAYRISTDKKLTRFHSKSEPKISSDRVFAINEDSQGNIWLGTNVGLTKLDFTNNTSSLYYKQKGLPNDFIYSVLIDDDDKVWVSTNSGISVLNSETKNFKNYTSSDGLQHNEFNGKAGYMDENGLFYFGGISGVNIFDPNQIAENPNLPEVHIESVELFNHEIDANMLFLDKLRFKSRENVLTFNFAALNFLNPEKCIYAYKMEGFDADWRHDTKQRSTTYTNLDPGEYTFVVKATNDAGVWNPQPASVHITIVPPLYQKTWFRVIFIVVFLLSGFLYYLYQTQKLKRDKLKLERIVAHRTRQVQQKNKKLQKAFIEAERQRDNISFLMKELRHRVKNNLQIVSSLLNLQSNSLENESAKQALKMARTRIIAISQVENKITGEGENTDLGQFIKEISEKTTQVLSVEEKLKYNLLTEVETVQLKNVNTTLIGLILNELITNAAKYAFDRYNPKNTLKVGCIISGSNWILTVNDNGKGYHPKRARKNSLGLKLVNDMVQQLGGTITVKNNRGTKNTIIIPIT